MKKFIFTLLVSFLVTPTLDAGILRKKYAKGIKNVAFISLTSPKRVLIGNYQEQGSRWTYVDAKDDKKAKFDKKYLLTEQSEEGIQALYDFALETFQKSLSEVSTFELKKFSEIKNLPAYVDFKNNSLFQEKVKDGDKYRVAEGMHAIPIDYVSDGVTRFGNRDPFKPQKESLAKLAVDLNVDAVAFMYVRFSVRHDEALVKVASPFPKGYGVIGAKCVFVTKDGRIAVKPTSIQSRLKKDFSGKKAVLGHKGKMSLYDSELRTSFFLATTKSAERMNKILNKAFSKLK